MFYIFLVKILLSRTKVKPSTLTFNKYKFIYRCRDNSKKYSPMPSLELTNSNSHNTLDIDTDSKPLDTTTIRSPPKIIPINTDREEFKKLKFLASCHALDKEKDIMIKRIAGPYVTRAGISEYYLIHDLNGYSKIEKYCGSCIEKVEAKLILVENIRKR
jgi:hypothetical protein